MNCVCGIVDCGIAYGLCHCECGGTTPIAKYSSVDRHWVRGRPTPYCLGHGANSRPRDPIPQPLDPAIRHVPLSNGMYAIVSAAKYELVMRYRWYALYDPKLNGYYAGRRRKPSDPKGAERISMHVFLLTVPKGFVVDHKNKNTLDNRDENLRQATPEENGRNQKIRKCNTSGVTGVNEYWRRGVWLGYVVRITYGGKRFAVGYCKTIEEGAEIRRQAELKYYGEFSPQNNS
jgi:hypothetical protein